MASFLKKEKIDYVSEFKRQFDKVGLLDKNSIYYLKNNGKKILQGNGVLELYELLDSIYKKIFYNKRTSQQRTSQQRTWQKGGGLKDYIQKIIIKSFDETGKFIGEPKHFGIAIFSLILFLLYNKTSNPYIKIILLVTIFHLVHSYTELQKVIDDIILPKATAKSTDPHIVIATDVNIFDDSIIQNSIIQEASEEGYFDFRYLKNLRDKLNDMKQYRDSILKESNKLEYKFNKLFTKISDNKLSIFENRGKTKYELKTIDEILKTNTRELIGIEDEITYLQALLTPTKPISIFVNDKDVLTEAKNITATQSLYLVTWFYMTTLVHTVQSKIGNTIELMRGGRIKNTRRRTRKGKNKRKTRIRSKKYRL